MLELTGAPAEIGAAHGEAHAAAIRAYAADRLARAADESGLSRAALLEIAAACLPAHVRYDAGLADEEM